MSSTEQDNSEQKVVTTASSEEEKEQQKNSEKEKEFYENIKRVVFSIFSRCGVNLNDIVISKPKAFDAKVSYNLNWSFKCRCSDKAVSSVSDETKVLSQNALEEFTQANTKELENENSAKTRSFIEQLSKSDFDTLNSIAGQIVCFNRMSAIGKARCKSCHGTNSVQCDFCEGKGVVRCPSCHGKGGNCMICHGNKVVKCTHCNGTGHVQCKDCKGTGEQTVEREIIYDATCKKYINLSLVIPETKKEITMFSEDDKNTLISSANFDDANTGSEVPHGFVATFEGRAPCFSVQVSLKDKKDVFDFIVCGKDLKPICKPPVLDAVFSQEAQILSETLVTTPDDVEEKIKCVKALSSKAILAKTIRSIENYQMEIVKNAAVDNGVTVESILSLSRSKKKNSYKAITIRSKVNTQLLEAVAMELIDNAEGYVSDDFARVIAKNLISFVPMLMHLNPNTKVIWAAVTLMTWMLMGLFLYAFPSIPGVIVCFILATLVCLFTSFALTKNWTYYSAVSMLKLTHKMKKVPSLNTEAIQSARLLIGAFIICLVTFICIHK